ncbi:MAG: orotidine 5'-phosphate decarboxylase / HUMPS family protein [Patescibacteria group bacterium]|nr:orotidine 5'-phosphate decarboxylase [Patescibacteria group bacterium]
MLNRKTRYIQIALNNSLQEAFNIIQTLPKNERILVEAGTPLIKTYGMQGIQDIKNWWGGYVVADLKVMDRGETEVKIAKQAGANAIVGLGHAPIETINAFIESCIKYEIDSMLDLMNVQEPIKVLRKLRKMPSVIILHRGVDETEFNKRIPLPYLQINKVRSSYNTLIAIAGGDTIREVQRAVFNDANIVVVWKEFYQKTEQTGKLAEEFLEAIK